MRDHADSTSRAAFTLVEVLVTVAVTSVLIALAVPALGSARRAAQSATCLSNLRSLGVAWHAYANDHDDQPMPAARPAGSSLQPTYWWGRADHDARTIVWDDSPIAGYLATNPHESGALECPAQPFGGYVNQPLGFERPTSTYGYNGYAFTPVLTGYTALRALPRTRHTLPRHRVPHASRTLVFGDAMIRFGSNLHNTHLLDPPELIGRRGWTANRSPTTSFRHTQGARTENGARTNALTVDGSARGHAAHADWIIDEEFLLGSLGTDAQEWYVPDAGRWMRMLAR